MRKLLSLTMAAIILAACSSNPNEHKPAPLPKLTKPTVGLNKIWSAQIGEGNAKELLHLRPAVQQNMTIAASRDGVLEAVNEQGKPVWRHKTGLAITGGVAAGYGLIIVGTAKGEVVAFGATDGQQRWKVTLNAAVLAPAALSAEQVVVQSNDGSVVALKPATGERLWAYDTQVPTLSVRGYAPPVMVDDMVLLATATGKVIALDAATGVGRWESQIATSQGNSEIARMVDLDADMMVTPDKQLYVVSYQGQLASLDLQENSESHWTYNTSSLQGVALAQDRVYLVDDSGSVLALDKANGKALWKQSDLGWRGLSNPVLIGDKLIVGDQQGYLHVLSPQDGRIVGRVRSHGAISYLQVQADRLLAYTSTGRLSSWQLSH